MRQIKSTDDEGNSDDNRNELETTRNGQRDEGRTPKMILIQEALKTGLDLRKEACKATGNKGYWIQSTETEKTCETNILVWRNKRK